MDVEVILPKTARKMKQEGPENDEEVTDWSNNSIGYHGKSLLIKEHFDEIAAARAGA